MSEAEAVTDLLKLSRDVDFGLLATKADLAALRSDLERQIAELGTDLRSDIADLRSEVAENKADILKWVFGMIAGAVLINVMAIVGAMLAAVRILGH